MLRLAKRFSDLRTMELMDVYSGSNRETAQYKYPGMNRTEAILQAENDVLDYLRNDFYRRDGAYIALWEEFGTYCSALRMEPYEDGYLLSGLETLEQMRRHGFGEMLVRAVLDTLDPGCVVYSHVHRRNKASGQLHKKCGFTVWKDVAVYLDGSADAGADTLKYTKA